MKTRNKIVYGISILLSFLPLSILVVLQSIFALKASFDSKLVINADEMNITAIIVYDSYNNDISNIIESIDDDGKPIMFSIIEATNKYAIIDFHGGELEDTEINILGIQFVLDNATKTEVQNGVVYLQFKNVVFDRADPDYYRDVWIRDFILDIEELYKVHFEQPQGTISYIWLKIITASIGTIIGIVTVALVILRKSTKALVKRYWRIAVLVALVEATILLGLITWIVTDIFQVFAAATAGWVIFLGSEKFAKFKGYLDIPAKANADQAIQTEVAFTIEQLLAQYRK